MPHIKFTDSKLKTLSADKTTWFTAPIKSIGKPMTKSAMWSRVKIG